MHKLAKLSLAASVALVPIAAMAAGPDTVEPPVQWEDVPEAGLDTGSPPAGVTWERRAAPPAPPPAMRAPAMQAAPPVAARPLPPAPPMRAEAPPPPPPPMMRAPPPPGAPAQEIREEAEYAMAGPARRGGHSGMRQGGGPKMNHAPAMRGPRRAGGQWSGGQWSGEGGRHGSFHTRVGRGWRMPGYWYGPRFRVSNWGMYGFPQPPQGSYWVRYYDDALLVDDHGIVLDGRSDMDWDRYGERWDTDELGIPGYPGEWGEEDHGYGGDQAGYLGYGYGPIVITETTVTSGGSSRRHVEKRTIERHVPTHKPRHVRRPYQGECGDACAPPPPPPPPVPRGEKG